MRNLLDGAHRAAESMAGRVACAASLSLCLVLGCDMGGAGAAAPTETHALVGATAPAFEIPTVAGDGTLSPQGHDGKVVIVDFWATWCDPCKESFPFYQSLVDRYAGKVVVLAVSVDEEPEAIAGFIQETGVKFPVGWDEGQAIAHLYNPEKMPTSYVVDTKGVVSFVHAGFADGEAASITRDVESLLK